MVTLSDERGWNKYDCMPAKNAACTSSLLTEDETVVLHLSVDMVYLFKWFIVNVTTLL